MCWALHVKSLHHHHTHQLNKEPRQSCIEQEEEDFQKEFGIEEEELAANAERLFRI